MIYDEEDLLKSIKNFVKANLETEITAINTEKGDFNIDSISADDAHFVIVGELLDLPNHMYVSFSIDEDIETLNNVDDIMSAPVITIEIAFDNPKKANTYYKSLRYMRALYQTVVKYESSTVEVGELKITKAIPMLVTNMNRELIVSGVEVSVAIG